MTTVYQRHRNRTLSAIHPTSGRIDVEETTVILANLPEPIPFSDLAASINAAFGPTLRASVTSERLVLETLDTTAYFDSEGRCVGALNRPTQPSQN